MASNLLDRYILDEGSDWARNALAHLARIYPEIRPLLQMVIEGKLAQMEHKHQNLLRRYGIVVTEAGGAMTVNGKMMLEGLRQALIGEEPAPQPQLASTDRKERGGLVEEWADELAEFTRRRAKVERKMREVIQYLVGADNMAKSQKKSVADRILACVPEGRRAKLMGLRVAELLDRMFWLELEQVIEKDWQLFERVFGSIREFNHHVSEVNKRYDAHAKGITPVEIVAHKDSLSWFEECFRRFE